MIYQEEVTKIRELRCVVMGREIVVVDLKPPTKELDILDWKAYDYKDLIIRECEREDTLVKAIYKFMELSGLVFGSFDIAVDQAGRYVFFEINQQGQFLWIEECNPQIKLLDRMAKFLLNGGDQFVYEDNSSSVISYSTYLEANLWQQDCAFEAANHIAEQVQPPRPDM